MISVIMGIYNCEHTLEDAINSIINQTYTDWELIMCDDGSTDNSYEIAKKFEKEDKRIKVIKNNTPPKNHDPKKGKPIEPNKHTSVSLRNTGNPLILVLLAISVVAINIFRRKN